jgi:hypothetical protein
MVFRKENWQQQTPVFERPDKKAKKAAEVELLDLHDRLDEARAELKRQQAMANGWGPSEKLIAEYRGVIAQLEAEIHEKTGHAVDKLVAIEGESASLARLERFKKDDALREQDAAFRRRRERERAVGKAIGEYGVPREEAPPVRPRPQPNK